MQGIDCTHYFLVFANTVWSVVSLLVYEELFKIQFLEIILTVSRLELC